MVKLMSFIRRRPDLTQDQFFAHWRDVHAPLIRRHAETLGIKKYVQTRASEHTTAKALNDGEGSGDQAPYDGVAELWLEDPAVFTSPNQAAMAAMAEIGPDHANFVDSTNSYQFLGQEFPVIDPD